MNLSVFSRDEHCDGAIADRGTAAEIHGDRFMSHQKATIEAHHEQLAAALSFEVLEVVSLLAAFEECVPNPQAEHDEDYDPFAPGFPGVH